MSKPLLAIFAHPDDEAFGPSGTIAKYANERNIYIICVTDGDDKTKPRKNLAEIRKNELKNSAKILGVKKVFFLGYKDGELRNNIYHEVTQKIEKIAKLIKPDTFLTFEQRGISGHLDHVFCSMVTSFAFEKLSFVKTLLYYCVTYERTKEIKGYFIYFPPGYKIKEIDRVVDVSKYWDKKLAAMKAHESQAEDAQRIIKQLKQFPKKEHFLVKKNN